MKKILFFLLFVLFALFVSILSGCSDNLVGVGPDGITHFVFDDNIRFEYNWSTSTMTGINDSSTPGTFVFIIDDGTGRTGSKLSLPPLGKKSYTRVYQHGVRLRCDWNYDGRADHFIVKLQ